MICCEIYHWRLPLTIECHWDFERFWNFGWAPYDFDLRLPNGWRRVRSTASNISRPLSKHDQPNIITTTITTIIYHHIHHSSTPKKKRYRKIPRTWTFLRPGPAIGPPFPPCARHPSSPAAPSGTGPRTRRRAPRPAAPGSDAGWSDEGGPGRLGKGGEVIIMGL